MPLMNSTLPPGYRIVELTLAEYKAHWDLWGPQFFLNDSTNLDVLKLLSEEEKAQTQLLGKNLSQLVSLYLGVFFGDEFCGWFSGNQMDHETFYMRNSAIIPAHRRKGLYTALMQHVLSQAQSLGFQIVLSRHHTTNNPIIIPKLKIGFIISAIELSDRFGAVVHLRYYFNGNRRSAMDVRSGEKRPRALVKSALGLD